MSGCDKWQKNNWGAEQANGTEDEGGCYFRQDRQGKPLSLRWHLNKDLKEVRGWVTWTARETAFQAEGLARAGVWDGSMSAEFMGLQTAGGYGHRSEW